MFLGGGGYNLANTSRLWCSIISLLVNQPLKSDIPEHDFFLNYGPDYELNINSGRVRNKNSLNEIDRIIEQIMSNLSNIVIE